MAVSSPTRRVALEQQARQVRRTERKLLDRADRMLFASTRDLEDLLPEARQPADATSAARLRHAAVVPNGVDTAFWSRSAPTLGTDEIVFTGAMSYAPNVDAAVRLARVILPIVQREVPAARLTIVGRDPTPAVGATAEVPGVTVTGYVDDVRPYLERAAVFAAPLRFGAGIQNKLLEAMSMAVPSVVSTLAADGLRTVDGAMPPIVIADGDEATASAIVTVLRRVAADPRPDDEAREYVTGNFVWARSGETIAELLTDASAERAAR
jgi:glycosyltransferase involved in cell wall biosynthesis